MTMFNKAAGLNIAASGISSGSFRSGSFSKLCCLVIRVMALCHTLPLHSADRSEGEHRLF